MNVMNVLEVCFIDALCTTAGSYSAGVILFLAILLCFFFKVFFFRYLLSFRIELNFRKIFMLETRIHIIVKSVIWDVGHETNKYRCLYK